MHFLKLIITEIAKGLIDHKENESHRDNYLIKLNIICFLRELSGKT